MIHATNSTKQLIMINIYCSRRRPFNWLLASILLLSFESKASSQDSSSITIHVSNTPIELVLRQIERQTGYSFYYAKPTLDGNEQISVSLNRATLTLAMNAVLKGRNISWQLKDGGITLSKKLHVTELNTDTIPNLNITGVVTDKSGMPLQGATVTLRGQGRGQGTDSYGRFTFSNIPVNATLIVSSVGYDTKQIRLSGQSDVRISLDTLIREIQAIEVVSTGYQDIPRERSTGSFVKLDNKLLNRSVSTNILDRILNVTNSLRNETMGTNAVTIRGLSTINANQKPLIVIDGFPYEEGFGASFQLALNNLNPNDVESITILRDAAASSIWGARSGNGVIVITTKKGKYNDRLSLTINSNINIIEKPDLNKMNIIKSSDAIDYERYLFSTGFYNSYNGPFTPTYNYPVVSPAIEILLAQKRGILSQQQTDEQLKLLSNHDIRKDVSKFLLRTSVNQQYNINVSAGTDKSSFYASIGYDKNLASNIGNQNDRFTFRTDNSFKPIKNLELNTFIQYVQSKIDANGLDYLQFIANGGRLMAPYTRLVDDQGNPVHISPNSGGLRTAYIDTVKVKGLLDWHYRPVDEIGNANNVTNSISARFGGNIKYTIVPGISAEIRGQYERTNANTENYYSPQTYLIRNIVNRFMFLNTSGTPQYPVPNAGILDNTAQKSIAWNFRAMLNINKSWNNQQLSGILGLDTRETKSNLNQSRKYGFDPNKYTYTTNMDFKTVYTLRPSGAGSTITDLSSLDGRLNRFLSYYGNAAYKMLNKYTISGSARIDASNFFGIKANQRYIPLWSAGISWDIDQEEFFKKNVFSQMKLRATYGFNGNLNNSATSLPTIRHSNGTSIYNSSQSFATLESPANPGLTWERVRMINLGLDFGLLASRISGSIDIYTKKGIDLIGPISISETNGFGSYTSNYASMSGKGLDLVLNALVVNRSLKLFSTVSFSYNSDKILDYYNQANLLKNGTAYVTGSLQEIGKPKYRIYGYKWGGLNPTNGSPMGIIKGNKVPFETVLGSTSSVPNTQPEDLVYFGNAMAPFFGNMLNTLSYKSISISFNIVYKFGYYFRRPSINYSTLLTNWGGHGDFTYRWKKPGDELLTNVPAIPSVQNNSYEFYRYSEVLIERGDHIRLQDLRISYDLQPKNKRTSPISTITVFTYANNLGIIWKENKAGLDPDFVDAVPNPKSIAFGLNIGF